MKSNEDLMAIYEGTIWNYGWESWVATQEGWKALYPNNSPLIKYGESQIFIPEIEIEE